MEQNTAIDGGGAKARAIRDMFSSIAHRYDLLNHFLSGNIDRLWRRRCFREVAERVRVSIPAILDVGCGTADLSIPFARLGPVVGCDFCHPMLKIGTDKLARREVAHTVTFVGGDAGRLPFADKSFDIAVSAFCMRNLVDLKTGLVEMRRVLKPGGILGILDFGMPQARPLDCLYRFYFQRVLPRIGAIISGVNGPYQYLPDSVASFAKPAELNKLMAEAGFIKITHKPLSAGIAFLLLAHADF